MITMIFFADHSLPAVLDMLVEGLRWRGAKLWGKTLVVKSALTQARHRLGVKPMVELFHTLARPLVQKHHTWAFYKDLRLIALDGLHLHVPDSPENATYFGRTSASHGQTAWPSAKVVTLVEVGTRVVLDAFVGRFNVAENHAAMRLVRSMHQGMLVLWDRGLVSYPLWAKATQKGTHLLGRIKKGMQLKRIHNFPDGSYLANFYHWRDRRKNRKGILVRIVEYTITDPSLPGFGEKYRLMTSLLDPVLYPAIELSVLYHERWEIEIANDELKTHLLTKDPLLRSRTPLGCLQEIYGWLIAHIAIRTLIFEAASKHGLDPDRISFVGAVRVIIRAIPRMQAAQTLQLPVFYEMLLDEIADKIIPPRRNRFNPRVLKTTRHKFPTKRLCDYHLTNPQKSFQEAIHVLN